MSDEQKPNLNLGQPPGRLKSQMGGSMRPWLVVSILLQLVVVAGVTVVLLRLSNTRHDAAADGMNVDQLQDVAQQLEDRSLYSQAASAWERYLDASPDAEDRAQVLYRIARMYMQAEQFDDAAAAFVKCEQAGLKNEDLKAKVGDHLITCLRRLGLYGEIGRELSRRVEIGGGDTKQGNVLATLAGESLTDADLDRMIERMVDQQMSVPGGGVDEARRQQMLDEFSRPEMRRQMLPELLRRQLFVRRARELKLDQSDEFRDSRQTLEDALLVSRFQDREFASIQPTGVDLDAFYKANSESYRSPESIEVVFEKLKEGEEAATVLADVNSADDFKKLVKERRAGTEDDLEPFSLTRGPRHPQLGNTDPLFELESGKWTTEPHANGDDRFLVLIENKTPAKTPPLTEIRHRVEVEYVQRKQHEIMQKVFEDLMTRYDVKIMPPDATSNTKTNGEDEKK